MKRTLSHSVLLTFLILASLIASIIIYQPAESNTSVLEKVGIQYTGEDESVDVTYGNQTIYNESGNVLGVHQESVDGIIHTLMFWADNLSVNEYEIEWELKIDISQIYSLPTGQGELVNQGIVTLDEFSKMNTSLHGPGWASTIVTLNLEKLVYREYVLSVEMIGVDKHVNGEFSFVGGNGSIFNIWNMTQLDCESGGHFWGTVSNSGNINGSGDHCALLMKDWLTLSILDQNASNLSVDFQYQWHYRSDISRSGGVTMRMHTIDESGAIVDALSGYCSVGSGSAVMSPHVGGGFLGDSSTDSNDNFFCEDVTGSVAADNGTTRGKLFTQFQFPCGNFTVNVILDDYYYDFDPPQAPWHDEGSFDISGEECPVEKFDTNESDTDGYIPGFGIFSSIVVIAVASLLMRRKER
jgi:hypothetical protein